MAARQQPASLLDRARGLSNGFKAAATVLGLVASVLGLVFLLWPNLQPERAPSVGSATFSPRKPELSLLTFGQYLDRKGLPRSPYSSAQLARRGALASFRIVVSGYRGRSLPLRELLVNNRTGDVVNQANKRTVLTPDRQDSPTTWDWWTPLPRQRGPFKILIEIYPPGTKPDSTDVTALDTTNTELFRRS